MDLVTVVGVILLSTFLGSSIAWAIARMLLGAIEQASARATVSVERPTILSASGDSYGSTRRL